MGIFETLRSVLRFGPVETSAVERRLARAANVGDLRRTDVAGARGVGMRTLRIRDRYDDESEHPEADLVADSHAHLLELLGL